MAASFVVEEGEVLRSLPLQCPQRKVTIGSRDKGETHFTVSSAGCLTMNAEHSVCVSANSLCQRFFDLDQLPERIVVIWVSGRPAAMREERERQRTGFY